MNFASLYPKKFAFVCIKPETSFVFSFQSKYFKDILLDAFGKICFFVYICAVNLNKKIEQTVIPMMNPE